MVEKLIPGRVGLALTRNNHCEATFAKTKAGLRLAGFRRLRRDMLTRLPECARWVVARVRPGSEFAVADDLTATGQLFAYAPHRVVVHERARAAGPREVRRKVDRDYPVFAGYVFVGCPHGAFVSRRSHDGILGVLGDSLGRPGLSPQVMAAICRLHVVGAFAPAAARTVAVGEAVQVELGGVSLTAVVKALCRAGVRVEVEIFGQLTPIEIGLDKIKADAL